MIIRNNSDIIISGRSGINGECRTSKKGKPFTTFTVCANNTWFSVSVSGNVNVHKGDAILIAGKFDVKVVEGKQYYNIYADYVNTVKQEHVNATVDNGGAVDITPDDLPF